MEELIKYFEQVEARLAALEAAEQGRSDEEREAAQEQRIAELTALTATLSAKIVALEAKIVTLEARPATIVEKVVEKAVAPEKPEVPENVNENENEDVNVNEDEDENEVKLDEETGEPELEVEFIEEEENAEPESPEIPEVTEAPKEKVAEPAVAEPAATVGQPVEVVSSVVPRLEDIRKGISLADRFLFQRELFGGNGELMNKSIETINGLGSLSEAEAYIRTNFPDWNKESNAYELFTNLLKRRW